MTKVNMAGRSSEYIDPIVLYFRSAAIPLLREFFQPIAKEQNLHRIVLKEEKAWSQIAKQISEVHSEDEVGCFLAWCSEYGYIVEKMRFISIWQRVSGADRVGLFKSEMEKWLQENRPRSLESLGLSSDLSELKSRVEKMAHVLDRLAVCRHPSDARAWLVDCKYQDWFPPRLQRNLEVRLEDAIRVVAIQQGRSATGKLAHYGTDPSLPGTYDEAQRIRFS